MSVSRASAIRLGRLVAADGAPAEISCLSCLNANRRCVVSRLSRRCSECLLRSQGCSLARSVSVTSSPDPSLTLEIALRSEIDLLLARLRVCLAQLDSLAVAVPETNVDSSTQNLQLRPDN